MDIKIKTLCCLVIAFSLLNYCYFLGVMGLKGGEGDFIKYWHYTEALTKFNKDLPASELTVYVRQVYLPLFFVFLMPLLKVGYFSARVIWLVASQIALFFSLYLLIKAMKAKLSLVTLCMLIFMLDTFLPIKFSTDSGQTSFFVLLSFSGCLYFLQKKQDLLAGFFLTFPILNKWYPVLFLIFLLWKKRYRCVLSCSVLVGIMVLISILLFGFRLHYLQFTQGIPWVNSLVKGAVMNHSLVTNFQRLFRQDLIETRGFIHSLLLANFFSVGSVLLFFFLTAQRLFAMGREITDTFTYEFVFFICFILLVPIWISISHLALAFIPLVVAFLNIEKVQRYLWIFITSFVLLGLEYWPDGLAVSRAGWGLLLLSGRAVGMVLLWFGFYKVLSLRTFPHKNLANTATL